MSRESQGSGHGREIKVYIYHHGGVWYAETIDLALLARGSSADEAYGNLNEMLVTYQEVATERGQLDAAMARRASMRRSVWVHAQSLLSKVRTLFSVHSKTLTVGPRGRAGARWHQAEAPCAAPDRPGVGRREARPGACRVIGWLRRWRERRAYRAALRRLAAGWFSETARPWGKAW